MEPTLALRIAKACLANARDFAEQATALAESGSHGRAVSFAILGQEEVGKAVYFHWVAIGAVDVSPNSLRKLRLHVGKQMLGHVFSADVMIRFADGMVKAVETSLGPACNLPQRDLEDMPRDEVQRHLDLIGDAFAAFLERSALTVDAIAVDLTGEVKRIESKWLDRLKQRGLYVDYNEDSSVVSVPADISERDSEEQIAALSHMLDVLGPTLDAMNGEELARFHVVAGSFIERLRGRLRPS